MNDKIWLSSPHMGGTEEKYVKLAFDENWIAPLGPNVNGFEQDLKTYNATGAVAALNSGTGAIHLALILLGVSAGDEVLCSSFTFCASVNPICYLGAKPILVDSEKTTWNCDPQLLEEAIVDRIAKGKQPKAFVLVHLYGMPAKMEEIIAVCAKYGIPVVEDAAEALGSTYNGKKIGTFGEFGVFSFNGNKIITTSGGGALVAEDEEIIAKARFLSTQARDEAPHYEHTQVGYNYRMSNISAGIGRGQMEVLDKHIANRRANHAFYLEHLDASPKITFLLEPAGFYSNRWLTCVLFTEKGLNEKVRLRLLEDNIESRPLWKPMHLQPVHEKAPFYGNGTSEFLFEYGLCLPSGSDLTEGQLQLVVDAVKSCLD
jgi:dTDP-4-amino-4,6-dideoxygalactose transaminase